MKNNEANDGHSAVLSTAGFGGLMLITLGDLWADQCECGERAEFGAATVRGPDGCAEAVRTGRVFCDKHIPAELMPPNAALRGDSGLIAGVPLESTVRTQEVE